MARDIYEDHDEVSEPAREMLSSGLIILTTLVLLAAVFFMQKALNNHYKTGFFAENSAPSE